MQAAQPFVEIKKIGCSRKTKNSGRVILRSDRAYLPLAKTIIVGPAQTVTRILPYRVAGSGIQGIVATGQLPGILCSVSLAESGLVRLQIFNATAETKMLSARLTLVAVLGQEGVKFVVTEEEQTELIEGDENAYAIRTGRQWVEEFPRVFEEARFDYDGRSKGLTVTRNEIVWRIPFENIPKTNRGHT